MEAKQEPKHHLLSRIVIAPLIVIILLVFLPLIALLIATHFFYGIVLQLVGYAGLLTASASFSSTPRAQTGTTTSKFTSSQDYPRQLFY